MFQVSRFKSSDLSAWDAFLELNKRGSFLFKRSFMDYHSNRFVDFSLMVYEKSKLVAIIPGSIEYNKFISHGGLTYGGIVADNDLGLVKTVEVFKSVLIYLKTQGIDTYYIKSIPKIYHVRPADELDWILFKVKAKLYRRDTALAIDNRVKHLPYQERRRRAIKKAGKNNIALKQGFAELAPFWNEVLIPNLQAKHGVAPVHSLAEIELLASRFPENILQHTIYMDDTIVAGCTIFLNTNVAHAQYISGTELGRNSGCLDYLFDHLIRNVYASYPYFDFGICNEQNGEMINKGLLDWKEGFGARTIVHDFYEIDTASYKFLENYTT